MSTHISMNTHIVCGCNNEDCRVNGCLMKRQQNEAGRCSTRSGGNMNIRVLTDEQVAKFVADIIKYAKNSPNFVAPLYAIVARIEQAVLQSPEVQALIIAAQEFNGLYGWLWDTTDGGGFLSPDGVKQYDAAHHKLRVALCNMTGKPLPIDPDED